ncbi:hypothetical protein K4039_13725 [Lyngbya sp. CCAP 1446/10]|uniref:hypothetical protein n=1 Tax=Lyngbya sp. CCAP 1446/10 TaxID=439293 RepID=UPI002237A447|nr:hypothetical protein [Lyngbya sp. CCAP 1446/10]MCW6051121.1 hypothetical protein [Lyngbya sp. CCAP 1446/10]
MCCDTVLRAIETFKTSIELIDRFPQSTSLAKINRWMLKSAVFRRSNWLLEGLHEAQKVPVLLKWYSNCVTRTSPPVLSVGHPRRSVWGTGAGEESHILRGNVKVAVI